MNENQTTYDAIVQHLDEIGWNSHEIFHYKIEFKIAGVGKTQYADIVLFAKGKAIGVIEIKKPGYDLNLAILQAKSYAEDLDTNLIYATDGTDYLQFNPKTNLAEKIDGIPTVLELQENNNFNRYE